MKLRTIHLTTNGRDYSRKTQVPTLYIDVKSKELQEILVEVLGDIRGLSLSEDNQFWLALAFRLTQLIDRGESSVQFLSGAATVSSAH